MEIKIDGGVNELTDLISQIEKKYGVKAIVSKDMEEIVSNLEYQFGTNRRPRLGYKRRLEGLLHTPDWVMKFMKRIAKMESVLGIQSQMGCTMSDRIQNLAKVLNIEFSFDFPLDGRIDTLWTVLKNKGMLNESNVMGVKPDEFKSSEDSDAYKRSVEQLKQAETDMYRSELLEKFQKFLDSQEELVYDTKNMLDILPYILQLQAQKAAVYGRSYCRHGDLSIFLNTERKWDRISNIMDKAMTEGTDYLYSDKSGTATETFVDTIVDLASYSLLWLGYINENHPELFQRFIKDNKLNLE